MGKRLFTKEEIDGVIYRYQTLKMGREKAGEPFNLSERLVKRLLEENGIDIRHKDSAKNKKRKFNVDDDYFDTQSPNMAYILGFWAADGNISSSESRLDLELASVDIEILKKIREEIKCERPIKIYQCSNGYVKNKLLFWSSKIKKTFIEYGVVPNKTYSKDFTAPLKLDKKYWIDYIRGFFDGDGCIKKNGYTLSFELNSTNKDLLISLQEYLQDYYKITTKISTTGMKGRNIPMYRLYCYAKEAEKIYEILYTPDSLYLDRKYQKWQELLK